LKGEVRDQTVRRYILSLLLVAGAAIGGALLYRSGVGRTGAPNPAPAGGSRPAARVVLQIEGMDCVMCAAGLQSALRAIPGVRHAEVSFQDKQAVLEYDPAAVDASRFEKVIADSGFKVALPAPSRP
jgi:copper chaperone CopZ